VPEAIQSVPSPGTNICQLDQLDDASATSSPTPPLQSPINSHLELVSDAAVGQLVKAHPSAGAAADCRAEGVALGTAGVKAAISLGAVLLSAPTEVGLPLTIGRFVVEAMLLGAAAASYENCKEAANKKAK
jgi:hypothetical protein